MDLQDKNLPPARHASTDRRSHLPAIRRWFDLPIQRPGLRSTLPEPVIPAPGQIMLLTGPSGSGKSRLLRRLRRRSAGQLTWIRLDQSPLPKRPLIDCFLCMPLTEALDALARVGLAEAALFERLPARLSDGQRFRLRLALALCQAARHRPSEDTPSSIVDRPDDDPVSLRKGTPAPVVLWCDEFAATLDDVTAAVVARAIRRAVVPDSSDFSVILASGREGLLEALEPDLIVRCDFDRYTFERTSPAARLCPVGPSTPFASPSAPHPRSSNLTRRTSR
ncbi:MAG: AAA family ATPase [Phycisphaerae bacterium]|nr:AAA family ATPase [Phycisphaerae bacterium]MDW8263352.1 AAA family ATPase [Phycisphaerales bacterium]